MWITDNIFHEKQDARLCAQHCLNASLQGSYFTAVDLSKLAQDLDDQERIRMSENGLDSNEYRDFISQPSGNMDDTGYFSIQVIARALETFNLELIPVDSTDERAQRARNDPTAVQAFIFNMESHWFCVRRFHTHWFNLNSLLNKPKYMSSLYLTEYLRQMKEDGYAIFIVSGVFPDCIADHSPPFFDESVVEPPTVDLTSDDDDLQRAIQLSLSCSTNSVTELEKALEMSLESFEQSRSVERTFEPSVNFSSSNSKQLEISHSLKKRGVGYVAFTYLPMNFKE
ncbi:Ataxin-3 [Pseudolycoriella hygida]|uniref:ubiquitinyl hydrolase 1 n=1 Tax=Pseudolycoriella hygida TaxID=35572 RepID=A0A9Q0S3B9_9DIPT|nr:Ataxin-3 [Pseudolycoriella hygida]